MTKSSELVFETKAEAFKAIAEFADECKMENGEVSFFTRIRCDGKIVVEVYKKVDVDF